MSGLKGGFNFLLSKSGILSLVIHGWANISIIPIEDPSLFLGFLFNKPLKRDLIAGDNETF